MANRYFGIGEETTFKTAVAAAKYIDIIRESIIPDKGWVIVDTAAHRTYRKKYLGAYRGRGPVEFPAEPENGLTKILKWVLGDVTSEKQGATSAYKHTFKPADTIKSFTGRVGVVEGSLTAERVLPGCLVNSLALRYRHGEEVRCAAEIFNAGKESKTSIGSPTFSDLDPFVFSQAKVEFEDTEKAIVAEAEVRMNNNIPFDRGVLGDDTFPYIKVGRLVVDGRLSLWFETADEYDRFLAGTEFKLEILTEGPAIGETGYNYTLNVILPKCVYLRDTAPHVDRREQCILDAPFQGFWDAVEEAEVKIEVINEETTI